MRGARWLAGLACSLLLLVPAASFAANAREPDAPPERMRPPSDAPRVETWEGTSALVVTGACLQGGVRCVGDASSEEGVFFLPTAAQGGDIVVSWSAVDPSLRVLRIRAAGLVVEGESPVAIPFDGLESGEHTIRAEPARRVIGHHEQKVDWIATFVVTPAFNTMETRGQSGYTTGAGCALGACDPLTRFRSDTMVVPWSARGDLLAEWDALDGPMRISIPGTGFAAEGTTPLALELSGITAGEWRVQVAPAGAEIPLEEVSVGWVVRLVEAR